MSKHESYSKASKHPQLRPKQPNELLLDHEFCRLFKALEGESQSCGPYCSRGTSRRVAVVLIAPGVTYKVAAHGLKSANLYSVISVARVSKQKALTYFVFYVYVLSRLNNAGRYL